LYFSTHTYFPGKYVARPAALRAEGVYWVRIEDLHQRLIEVARQRVRAGQLTERGLARLCGLSQPHMHNVLKNIRALSMNSADRLMQALDLSLPDPLWQFPDGMDAGVRVVPVIRDPIGPGMDASLSIFQGNLPFPEGLVKYLVRPVAARLAPDLVLPKPLAANDLALLDQNPADRRQPSENHCWVVADGPGLRIRYVRLGGAMVYLANEPTVGDPRSWQSIPLAGREILDVVRARIVWIGRKMELAPAGPAHPSGGFD
jgi:hypothetical protein